MAKLYSDKSQAEKIAANLTGKGKPHTVVEQDGQFKVMATTQASEASDASNQGPEVVTTDTPAKSVEQAVSQEPVTVDIEGAKLTPMYVITPHIGGTVAKDRTERPRWFERKRLLSAEEIKTQDGKVIGVRITAAPKEFLSRGLKELVAA